MGRKFTVSEKDSGIRTIVSAGAADELAAAWSFRASDPSSVLDEAVGIEASIFCAFHKQRQTGFFYRITVIIRIDCPIAQCTYGKSRPCHSRCDQHKRLILFIPIHDIPLAFLLKRNVRAYAAMKVNECCHF